MPPASKSSLVPIFGDEANVSSIEAEVQRTTCKGSTAIKNSVGKSFKLEALPLGRIKWYVASTSEIGASFSKGRGGGAANGEDPTQGPADSIFLNPNLLYTF